MRVSYAAQPKSVSSLKTSRESQGASPYHAQREIKNPDYPITRDFLHALTKLQINTDISWNVRSAAALAQNGVSQTLSRQLATNLHAYTPSTAVFRQSPNLMKWCRSGSNVNAPSGSCDSWNALGTGNLVIGRV